RRPAFIDRRPQDRRRWRKRIHSRRVLDCSAGPNRASGGSSMSLLVGAWTMGLILSMLALGVFISFRVFHFPDITADGSLTLGAAVAAALLVKGVSPLVATTAGFLAGMLAGSATAILHTRFKINGLLSGILVMTALYSINLRVMGKSNVPLLSATTLATRAEQFGMSVFGQAGVHVAGWEISTRDLSLL